MAASRFAGRELVEYVEEDQQPDRACDDLVGGVGLGAMDIESSDGFEDLQPGGDQQRRAEHATRLHSQPGQSGQDRNREQSVDRGGEDEPGRVE